MQQTALDLVARGVDVHVAVDAISSRVMADRLFAIQVSPALPHEPGEFFFSKLR